MLTMATVLSSSQNAATSDYPLMWAGHQISFGTRDVPFRGEVTTRTDTLVLARVKIDGSKLIVLQEACAVRFGDVGEVKVSMDASALPRSRMAFELQDDGKTFASKSQLVWGEQDLDGDGNPGVTVSVEAPVCSGDLYVSNRSRTHAQGTFSPRRFSGTAKVKVEQQVLGTRGHCLGVVARDTTEVVAGPFAYVKVDKGTTCAELIRDGWPVDAES
jgi:hypothetical protein